MKRMVCLFILFCTPLYGIGTLPVYAAPSLAVAPTIFAVTPSIVYNSVDAEISIMGVGFVDPPLVVLTTHDLPPVVLQHAHFSSSTLLMATIPAATTQGIYDLTVYNPDGGQSNTLSSALTILRRGDAYMSSWSETTPLTEGRVEFAAVATTGNLYVIGGATGSGGMAVNSVLRASIGADGQIGAWQSTSPLNIARCMFRAVTSGQYIYAIGGGMGVGFPTESSIERSTINPDGSLGPWEIIGNLPEIRFNAAAVIANDYLYVMDGWASWSSNNPPPDTIRAQITAGGIGPWVPVAATAGRSEYAVSWGSFVFVLNDDGSIERSAVHNDGSLDAWAYVPATQDNHANGGLAVFNGGLVALGGLGGAYPDQYGRNSVERAAIQPDGSLGAWERASSMLHNRAAFPAVSSGGQIYAIGGAITYPNGIRSVERADLPVFGPNKIYLPAVMTLAR